jgi:hypothetical protein
MRTHGYHPRLGYSVITYLSSSLFLSLNGNNYGDGMLAVGQSAQMRMPTFVPHHLLLLAKEAAAGRRRSLICRAHFSRDGVFLFQATVSNRPRPPNSRHCECKRQTVVFPRCQLRTGSLAPLIFLIFRKRQIRIGSVLFPTLETGLDSAAAIAA